MCLDKLGKIYKGKKPSGVGWKVLFMGVNNTCLMLPFYNIDGERRYNTTGELLKRRYITTNKWLKSSVGMINGVYQYPTGFHICRSKTSARMLSFNIFSPFYKKMLYKVRYRKAVCSGTELGSIPTIVAREMYIIDK